MLLLRETKAAIQAFRRAGIEQIRTPCPPTLGRQDLSRAPARMLSPGLGEDVLAAVTPRTILARGRLRMDSEGAQYAAVYAEHELEDEVRVVGGEHVGAG